MKKTPPKPDEPSPQAVLDFDGKTFEPELDGQRLTSQFWTVFALMKDCQWRTLSEIASATSYPESSVSARLRDYRKQKFGQHKVERERVKGACGLYRYRLTPNPQAAKVAADFQRRALK